MEHSKFSAQTKQKCFRHSECISFRQFSKTLYYIIFRASICKWPIKNPLHSAVSAVSVEIAWNTHFNIKLTLVHCCWWRGEMKKQEKVKVWISHITRYKTAQLLQFTWHRYTDTHRSYTSTPNMTLMIQLPATVQFTWPYTWEMLVESLSFMAILFGVPFYTLFIQLHIKAPYLLNMSYFNILG